jgi:catalase
MPSVLVTDLLDMFDEMSGGVHPGFRPAHAKGLMCIGTFGPSPAAAGLTRASHATRPSTPVTLRYSNSTGIPTIPDTDPTRSGPRGIAVRFHLADHVHTDIVAHSTNGFPVRTGEEFLQSCAPRSQPERASPRHSGPFSRRTQTPGGLLRHPSRSQRASRGRRSSP